MTEGSSRILITGDLSSDICHLCDPGSLANPVDGFASDQRPWSYQLIGQTNSVGFREPRMATPEMLPFPPRQRVWRLRYSLAYTLVCRSIIAYLKNRSVWQTPALPE